MMDMPTPCPGCGENVELHDMTPWRRSTDGVLLHRDLVCPACAEVAVETDDPGYDSGEIEIGETLHHDDAEDEALERAEGGATSPEGVAVSERDLDELAYQRWTAIGDQSALRSTLQGWHGAADLVRQRAGEAFVMRLAAGASLVTQCHQRG